MLNYYTGKIINKASLTYSEAFDVMNCIIGKETSDIQKAGFLTAIHTKGETAEEIAGFVSALREHSIKVENKTPAIDVCGTGGDNSSTFNISTATAFVLAGAGIKIAKHGNRSVTSKSGSADVLQELGVNISLSPEETKKSIDEIGIGFIFAQDYHPAIKGIMPLRKELGLRTVFNLIGPLLNPANLGYQIIGVPNYLLAQTLSDVLKYLPVQKASILCCNNRYDELILNGDTMVFNYRKDYNISSSYVNNLTLRYPEITVDSIKSRSVNESAVIIKTLFSINKKTPYFYTVAANAAMTLYYSGYSNDLSECISLSEHSILSGNALNKLNDLIEFGRS